MNRQVRSSARLTLTRLAAGATLLSLAGCGTSKSSAFDPESTGAGGSNGPIGNSGAGGTISPIGSGGATGGSFLPDDAGMTTPPHACSNLECRQTTCALGDCQQKACSGAASTTVSGTVYDPAGKIPLYNAIVYVPNAALDPIVEGASCEKCGAISGSPIASTLTDTKGQFRLVNVPVGSDVPLVIQIGKWRRQIKVPAVAACTDTPLSDHDMTRLPKNKTEGDMPKMALTTGKLDALECLLRKIGIDDSEFTTEASTGRVNLYAGYQGTSRYTAALNAGAAFTTVEPFWNTVDSLKKYDVVLMACDGEENPKDKSVAARQAMLDYTSLGGRVFMSHWNNFWLEKGPMPFPTVATFHHQPDLTNPFTADLDVSFPKGKAFADWLVNVQGSTVLGKLDIREAQHTIDAVNPALAQRWIYSTTPQSVQYLTANTPMTVPPEDQCGRVVLSDIHVSAGDTAGPAFPSECKTTDLTPQEKALEFMLFDLTSCVRKDDLPPEPPAVVN